MSSFHWRNGSNWSKFDDYENEQLSEAYEAGQKSVILQFRGEWYEFDFDRMIQKNCQSHKVRDIRPDGPQVSPRRRSAPSVIPVRSVPTASHPQLRRSGQLDEDGLRKISTESSRTSGYPSKIAEHFEVAAVATAAIAAGYCAVKLAAATAEKAAAKAESAKSLMAKRHSKEPSSMSPEGVSDQKRREEPRRGAQKAEQRAAAMDEGVSTGEDTAYWKLEDTLADFFS